MAGKLRACSLNGLALAFHLSAALDCSVALAQDVAKAAAEPRDAGARYGQAVGVLEVCAGSKLTEKAKALATTFTGAELETFNKQAAKVLDAWVKVRACVNQEDPNVCKIIMDQSCFAAEREIGPDGAAYPGLVEFLVR